jgi:hypothetical protein
LQYGLAVLATRQKWVGGAIEGVAVIDHQFQRGGNVPVFAIIQRDAAIGHGILQLRTKTRSFIERGRAVGHGNLLFCRAKSLYLSGIVHASTGLRKGPCAIDIPFPRHNICLD